jgi:Predicted ATPase (AAA+ superfamily)
MTDNEKLHKTIMESYRPRVVDTIVKDRLSMSGGILITGPKWCGKSWTGMYHATSSLMLGSGDTKVYAKLSPEKVLDGEYPRLIDEWQDVPTLWDTARINIDFVNKKGMYIFTGSTFPKESVYHTGTGRFAKIGMKTMSLFESGNSNGSISLSGLFSKERIDTALHKTEYETVVKLICRGGWPGTLDSDEKTAMRLPFDYIESIISTDLSALTGTRKNPSITERVLKSLARNSASTVKINTIADDVSGSGQTVSDQTVGSYIESLKSIFIMEEQYPWHPSTRSKARLRSMSKLHFTDPSLAVAALGTSPESLVKDPNTSGLLFESLCYRDLTVYASTFGGKVYHYRDNNGLEIDNIIEIPGGKWGAAEIKLGEIEIEKAAKNLLRLNNIVEEKASFLSIITGAGGIAYTREDGVHVIPITLLGP